GVPHLVPVRPRLDRMGDAVHLYDQAPVETDEVEIITAKRRLPPKMKPLGAQQLQLHPQSRLRRRQRLSHGAGSGDDRHGLQALPTRPAAPATLPMKGREKHCEPYASSRYPAPRTVCSMALSKPLSILERRRLMCTSMTLV